MAAQTLGSRVNGVDVRSIYIVSASPHKKPPLVRAVMAAPDDDPFDGVHAEVRATWDEVERAFAQWRDQRARADWHALDATASEIRSRLRDVDWDLQDLDEAVRVAEADPPQFGLTAAEVSTRKAAVTELHTNVARVTTALADPEVSRLVDAAKRAQLLTSAPARPEQSSQNPAQPAVSAATPAPAGDDAEQHDAMLRQQDDGLDDLAVAVHRIGEMGKQMHTELEQHGDLLEDLESGVDHTRSRMRTVHDRLDDFVNTTSRGELCTIVTLFFVFIFLTFLVFAT